jgi:hypothetical protein
LPKKKNEKERKKKGTDVYRKPSIKLQGKCFRMKAGLRDRLDITPKEQKWLVVGAFLWEVSPIFSPVASSECLLEYFSINPTGKPLNRSRYPLDNAFEQAFPHQVA